MSNGRIIVAIILAILAIDALAEGEFAALVVLLIIALLIFRQPVKNKMARDGEAALHRKYANVIGAYKETQITDIAEALGITEERVTEDLIKLVGIGQFTHAYIDDERGVFVVPKNTKMRGGHDNDKLGFISCPYCGEMIPRTVRYCYFCGKAQDKVQGIEAKRFECNQLIREAMSKVHDDVTRENLAGIGYYADSILKKFEEEPNLIDDQYKFMDYYLPKTLNTIKNYKELCDMTELDHDETAVKKEIEDSLDTIETAFAKILKKISIDGIFDLSADVSTLHTVLAQDGLTESDFDITAESAAGSEVNEEE